MVSKGCAEEEAAEAVQEGLDANAGFKCRGKGKSKCKGFSHRGTKAMPMVHQMTGQA